MLRLLVSTFLMSAVWFTPAVGAQNMYTDTGTTSAGLSLAVVAPLSDDVGVDPAVGLVLSGGFGGDFDAALSVLRTSGTIRDITSTSLGATVYIVRSNGLRIGPTVSVQRVSDGRSSATAASVGARVAQQLPAGRGMMVPQASFSATAVNGGGVQTSGSFALAGVLGVGKARLVVEPAIGIGFSEGARPVGSLTGGLVLSL